MANLGPELQAYGLGCQRGHRALFYDLDLSLSAGQAMQITGENGAGKTTLLKTLCGLHRPEAGRVEWRGQDVHEAPAAFGKDLLYIGHENAINPDLTPRENLRMLSRLFGSSGDVDSALKGMGLSRVMQSPCRALSAGQRRRVALARLGVSSAALWILDEPAAALDTQGRGLLAAQIAKHADRGGVVLFTTHDRLDLPGITPQELRISA